MKIIVCLDDRDGMLFNGRRQSADRLVRQRIMDQIGDQKLRMSGYSGKMFSDYHDKIMVSEDYMHLATEEDYCFVEEVLDIAYVQEVTGMIIYRWNKPYPSDRQFPVEQFCKNLNKISTFEFPGSSHERITEEVYGS